MKDIKLSDKEYAAIVRAWEKDWKAVGEYKKQKMIDRIWPDRKKTK